MSKWLYEFIKVNRLLEREHKNLLLYDLITIRITQNQTAVPGRQGNRQEQHSFSVLQGHLYGVLQSYYRHPAVFTEILGALPGRAESIQFGMLGYLLRPRWSSTGLVSQECSRSHLCVWLDKKVNPVVTGKLPGIGKETPKSADIRGDGHCQQNGPGQFPIGHSIRGQKMGADQEHSPLLWDLSSAKY